MHRLTLKSTIQHRGASPFRIAIAVPGSAPGNLRHPIRIVRNFRIQLKFDRRRHRQATAQLSMILILQGTIDRALHRRLLPARVKRKEARRSKSIANRPALGVRAHPPHEANTFRITQSKDRCFMFRSHHVRHDIDTNATRTSINKRVLSMSIRHYLPTLPCTTYMRVHSKKHTTVRRRSTGQAHIQRPVVGTIGFIDSLFPRLVRFNKSVHQLFNVTGECFARLAARHPPYRIPTIYTN